MKSGYTTSETKLIGIKWMDAYGNWHLSPTPEHIDEYIESYIDSQKILRPVSKITKELKP